MFDRERSGFRHREDVRVEIGRENSHVARDVHLVQKDRHRINFFARRTPGMPDLQRSRIIDDLWNDLVAEDYPKAWIAEHFGNVDSELPEKVLHKFRLTF